MCRGTFARVLLVVALLTAAVIPTVAAEAAGMPPTRGVNQVRRCIETQDGDAATVCRALGGGGAAVGRVDPFLMMDFFHVAPPGGFPNHPHRGFQTVTYMVDGAFRHTDSMGNAGTIFPGDVQWMTAGSGVIHSEMPVESRENTGIQLWVNLPRKLKMMPPNYQEIQASQMTRVDLPAIKGSGQLHLIGGEVAGKTGPGIAQSPLILANVVVAPNSTVYIPFPRDMNGFLFVINGTARFGQGTRATAGSIAVLDAGRPLDADDTDTADALHISTAASSVRFFFGAGKPLQEPIEAYGPFVMSTRAEIQQAFEDYRAGRLAQSDPAQHSHSHSHGHHHDDDL